jgi:chromosome condensin MukBEF complex kleisin-like MukF subunit
MNCPKCGSDRIEHDFGDPTCDEYLICKACGCLFTDWQQQRIAALEAQLKEAETALQEIRDKCHSSGDFMTLKAVSIANAYFKRKEEGNGL